MGRKNKVCAIPFTGHLPSSHATDARYHAVVLNASLRDHVTLHHALGPSMYDRHPRHIREIGVAWNFGHHDGMR